MTQAAALDSCRGDSQEGIDQYITRAYAATRFWSAAICQDDGIYTRVTELGKDKTWKIQAMDTDERNPGPDWFWEPYLWSVDGDYLYLTPGYLGSLDRPRSIYSSGFGITQLDLSNGVLNTWLKPYDGGYTFALSEDGRLFAFLSDIPRTIVVRDPENIRVELDFFGQKRLGDSLAMMTNGRVYDDQGGLFTARLKGLLR